MTICHLYISSNTPFLPPKILHNLCFVFFFLVGITTIPREIKNNPYAKFWGANKVPFGRCTSGELCRSVVVADTKLNKVLNTTNP